MKKQILPIFLFVAVFIVTSLLYGFGVFDIWQEKITDRFFLIEKPKQNIIIIAVDDQSLNAIGQWPWSRKTFATILPDLSKARVIGFDINFADPSSRGPADDATLVSALKDSEVPIVFPIELREDGLVSAKPLDIFTEHVSLGFTNIPVDSDGISRRLNNGTRHGSLAAVVGVGDSWAPSSNRIHYLGPEKTFTTIPFVDVYEHKIPKRVFEGATVFIGATANDLHDFLQTPFGLMPGVEVNANVAETLMDRAFIKEIAFGLGLFIIFLFELIAALIIIKIKRLRILIPSLIILFALVPLLSFSLFSVLLIFPTFYALIGLLLTSTIMLISQYVAESKEKRFIRSTFQYYLSGDVIEQLVNNPEKLRLGGEKRKVTILFSDVRDFTTISESMSPENLTSFMSEYFTEVSDIVMDKRGVIDKYIGDAIMAFWGAPLDNPHHAEDACRAALVVIEKLEEHNAKSKAKGLPVINTGFGINTGEVVVGNMGSKKRFNYTIVGDDVNFTSRLEGLTKEYGVTCIISESTKEEIRDIPEMYIRALDEVLVKGKKQPKKIFQLMKKPTDEKDIQKFKYFEEGRGLYIKGDWNQAIEKFEKALSFGDDKSSSMFIERCKALIANPPAEWTGIYQFKTK